MAVTAVVVNYNTRNLLERCLQSLHDWPEVIVVDNASSDGSASMVSERFPGVKLVRSRRNAGFGAGANAGIAQATSELVLVLNPDTWVTAGVAAVLEEFFAGHPQAGIAGCGLLDSEGRTLVSARRFYTLKSLLARRLAPGSGAVREFEMLESGHDDPRTADWVAGTGMALRKDLFYTIGGFDDRFFLYFEDVDICLRAWLAGSEIWYVPAARIYHDERRASSRAPAALGHHLRSWATFNRKWKSTPAPNFAVSKGRSRRSGESPMRAVIEARSLLGHLTGVGRSLESLVAHMAGRDDIEIVLLATSARRTRQIHKYRFYAKTLAIPVSARLVDLFWERGSLLPVELFSGRCDVVHGPNFVVPSSVSAAQVLTVHDLGFVRHPELHTPRQRRLARTAGEAIERSHRIIAVSEFTKNEICSVYGTDPEKIDVVYHGVRRLPPDGPPLQAGFPKEFLLFAGTLELRKGADILLDAYRIARGKDPDIPPLVIAGDIGLGGREALDAAFGSGLARSSVRVLERVPDTVLARLYRGATIFAFPSIYEGFGMPPVEAMAHGVPTIATALSALPEILGDGAHLVEAPLRPGRGDELAEAFAHAILEVLYDDTLRRSLAKRGKARASRFSWDRAAEQVVECYRRAVSEKT